MPASSSWDCSQATQGVFPAVHQMFHKATIVGKAREKRKEMQWALDESLAMANAEKPNQTKKAKPERKTAGKTSKPRKKRPVAVVLGDSADEVCRHSLWADLRWLVNSRNPATFYLRAIEALWAVLRYAL